jgi:ethanolamine utilization protein EutA
MSTPRTLLSVGIDVGTTTTQIIFSRLALADVARPGQIPRVAITAREVLYQSPIAFTPLLDRDTVDAARLNALVRQRVRRRGIDATRWRPAR